MKTFFTACMLFSLLVNVVPGKAQANQSRPRLFNGVENRIAYPKAELEKVFSKAKGSKFKISLPGNFNFSGTVVSSVDRYDNLKSFLIKSDVLNGAMFSLSRRVNEDGTITYSGRIINDKYSDGFELKADDAGSYSLNKINMDELIQDR